MSVPSKLAGTEVEQIQEWFTELGIVIPEPEPFALYPDEADESDQCWITPDAPDIEQLAHNVVHIVRTSDERFPGPRNWRRWKATRWVSRQLYVWGVTGSGGGALSAGADPVGGWIYDLPSLASLRYRRPYVLRLPMWWWECHLWQGWRVWRHHRPLEPFGFGICAACLPCPECGEPHACGCVL